MILEVKDETDMRGLGARIGALIRGGETIELIGDVGAGKTTLVKGIAKGMQIDDDIQSPSFTISRVYSSSSGIDLVHYDFYRLSDPGVLASELTENQLDKNTVTIIEWADIVEGVLPSDRLRIKITPTSEDSRQLELESQDGVGSRLMRALS